MLRMVVDTANVLFRVAAAHSRYNTDGTPEERAGLAMHTALQTVNKYFKQFKPEEIALSFEGHDNWRKAYTRSSECKSGIVYKANRVKDPSMAPFLELIASFEDLARHHTGMVCLGHPMLEGDDLIAGYAQHHAANGDDVIIISGDKDFVQLLKSPRIRVVNPDDGKDRTCEDPAFFMFEKCFRGDAGDNVMSAYPRIRKTRLLKAFEDEYELTNILNEQWEFIVPDTGEKRIRNVGEMFLENELLMDLERQPANIRQLITETIVRESEQRGKFSLFYFQKFCGKYGLKQISENISAFANLLNGKSPAREDKFIQEKKGFIKF